jgi:hypothetical protein
MRKTENEAHSLSPGSAEEFDRCDKKKLERVKRARSMEKRRTYEPTIMNSIGMKSLIK